MSSAFQQVPVTTQVRPSRPQWVAVASRISGPLALLVTALLWHLKTTTLLTARSEIPWDVGVGVAFAVPLLTLAIIVRSASSAPVTERILKGLVAVLVVFGILGAMIGWWAYMVADHLVEERMFPAQTSTLETGWFPMRRESTFKDKRGNPYTIVSIDPYGTGTLKTFKVLPADKQAIGDRRAEGYKLGALCLRLPVEQNGHAVRAMIKQRDFLPPGSIQPCDTSAPYGWIDS